MRAHISDRWIIAGLLLFSVTLKFNWLGANELGGDEPFTVFWALQPWSSIKTMLATENNPPLYLLLIKAWTAIVPLEEGWLRLPSALFSALTVWPLFLLGQALAGRAAAVVTCALYLLSDHQYAFAHEVRAYSLMLLLTVTAGWLLVRGKDDRGKRGTIPLAVVCVLLVWTHFFGWLVVGLIGTAVITLRELRPVRRTVLLAAGAAVVCFAPYALLFLQRAEQSMMHGTWVRPHGIEEMWHMVRRWSNQPVVTVLLLLPLIITLVRNGVRPLVLRFGLLWWLLPLIGLWLVQPLVPAYVDRYLLFASPGFYLVVGFALVELIHKGVSQWLAPAVGIGAMAFTFTPWVASGNDTTKAAVVLLQAMAREPAAAVEVYPFWHKLNVQWALDRTRFATPLWQDPWSTVLRGEGEGAKSKVVVCLHEEDDPAWLEVQATTKRNFPHEELLVRSGRVRVVRYGGEN